MLPALDLELIRTFLTVWETRGFKSAAEQLNKTPAAVSLQIRRLEEILGQRVLDRNNQGISLTSAGEILKEKGQTLIALNYQLIGDFQQSDLSGQLNFGAPTDYAPTLLQNLLPIFRREFPKASPNIILEPSRMLRTRISADTLDMAIVARENAKEKAFDLWSEEIGWYGDSINNDGNYNVGILTTDCILRDYALNKLKSKTVNYNIVMESATVASLRDAVEAGFCQAVLPSTMANGLEKSKFLNQNKVENITFSLITGTRFDSNSATQISRKFQVALNY